jgi:hypothetical protein
MKIARPCSTLSGKQGPLNYFILIFGVTTFSESGYKDSDDMSGRRKPLKAQRNILFEKN